MQTGLSRLVNQYKTETRELSGTIDEMGSSLKDLKDAADSFLQRMRVDRRDMSSFDICKFVSDRGGFVSLHEAFAAVSSSEGLRCLSAEAWCQDVVKRNNGRLVM